jgi:hypothetical protein
MKKAIRIILASLAILCTGYVVAATALIPTTDTTPRVDSVLIKTHWQQMGGFESCAPDKMRLGCWSTALAQIMYYHRLKPFGHVAYVSSKGYKINENMDSAAIRMDKLANQIDSTTNGEQAAETARYNYYAALAIQKDFGTDNYMNKLAPASLLEQHYKVKVSRYISWQRLLPYTGGKQRRIIKKEISSKRPVFLHFANLKNFGHSVVIDGYREDDGAFMVHLNQGQGGPQDGWYSYDKDLLKEGDRKLRVIYTFKPLK